MSIVITDMLLVVKTIFCPSDYTLNRFLDSLTRLHIYLELAEIQAKLLLVGWAPGQEEKIRLYLRIAPIGTRQFELVFWPLNYGKYHLWNDLIQRASDLSEEYLWYMDHDILPDVRYIGKHWKDLDSLFRNGTGVVHFNQLEDCRHQRSIYQNRDDGETPLVWTNQPDACASGCFLVPIRIMKVLRPLPRLSAYGLDDYYLSLAFQERGYRCCVMENVFVVHPYSTENEYQEWKYQTTRSLIEKIAGGTKLEEAMSSEGIEQHYQISIQESINFWLRHTSC